MLHEQTHDKLIAMKLFGMANALKDRLERRDHQDLSKTEFLGLLVDDEWLYRENRKLTARMKVAKFKLRSATVEAIDYAKPRGLRKDQVLELAQNRWLQAHESLLITGPSGSGKSFIAQAFGQHACRSGFTVQYLRMPALLALFVQARAQGTYDRLLKHFAKISLADPRRPRSWHHDRATEARSTRSHRRTLRRRRHDRDFAARRGRMARIPGRRPNRGRDLGSDHSQPRIGSRSLPKTPCEKTIQTCPMPDSLISNHPAYVASLRGCPSCPDQLSAMAGMRTNRLD